MVKLEDIQKTVKSILVEKFLIDESKIELTSTLDSLGLDSLDTTENIMELENAYDITIPDETNLDGLGTKVQDIIDYLFKNLN